MASPRSLTSIPYDAASQFNRYFDSDKVDCKYNPNSESPKTEFSNQPQPQGQPQQPPQPQQHPNSGKEQIVKSEPFGGLHEEVELFVNEAVSASQIPTTTTAQLQILVRAKIHLKCSFCGFFSHTH